MIGPNVGAFQLNVNPLLKVFQDMQRQRQFDVQNERQAQLMDMRQKQFAADQELAPLRRQQLEQGIAGQQFQLEQNKSLAPLKEQLLKRQIATTGALKPTPLQSNYEYARRQGYTGTLEQFMASSRPTTNINTAGESAYEKEMGKALAGEMKQSQKTAAAARGKMNRLKVLEGALSDPNLYTGSGGQTVQVLKSAAQGLFGVPVKGVSSGEIVSNLAKEIALGNKDSLPGPLSNSDRDFLVSMAPGLQNSPDGNRMIIQLGMLSQRYQIARAQAARQYAAQNKGRLDSGYYEFVSKIDEQFAPQFSGLMDQLRQTPTAPRAPTAGVPRIAINPTTGERRILQGNEWVPMK